MKQKTLLRLECGERVIHISWKTEGGRVLLDANDETLIQAISSYLERERDKYAAEGNGRYVELITDKMTEISLVAAKCEEFAEKSLHEKIKEMKTEHLNKEKKKNTKKKKAVR